MDNTVLVPAKWFNNYYETILPPTGVAPAGPDYGCAIVNKRPLWFLISSCGFAGTHFWFCSE